MATVQIRNLDDQAYDVLRGRAAASGRSLQEYLRLLLEKEARTESVGSAIARMQLDIGWRDNTVTMEDIVAIQRAGRER